LRAEAAAPCRPRRFRELAGRSSSLEDLSAGGGIRREPARQPQDGERNAERDRRQGACRERDLTDNTILLLAAFKTKGSRPGEEGLGRVGAATLLPTWRSDRDRMLGGTVSPARARSSAARRFRTTPAPISCSFERPGFDVGPDSTEPHGEIEYLLITSSIPSSSASPSF